MSTLTDLLKSLETIVLESEQALAEEETLLEDAGNLKDIPSGWLKIVAKSWGAQAGKDSEIKLLQQCKNVSKFRDGIINGMKEDGLSAIFVTVNDGPFALIYKKDSLSRKAEYSIVAVDGTKETTQKSSVRRSPRTVRSEYSRKGYYTTYDRKTVWYEQDGMPMSSVLPRLQGSIAEVLMDEGEDRAKVFDEVFKRAKVEIFGITFDKNRQALRKERSANKPAPRDSREGIKPLLDAAGKKFLKKKAGDVGKVLQDEVVKSLEGVTTKIATIMDEAAEGKVVGRINLSAELKDIQEKIDNISRLASAISDCVKRDGSVELVDRWRGVPEKSWSFKSLIDTLNRAKSKE